MKLAGLHLGHDCAFSILEEGKPTKHIELERIIRQKQPPGDPFQLLTDFYTDFKKINHFVGIYDGNNHMIPEKYPYAYKMIKQICKSNGGSFHIVDHHQAHAANAFFSSNLEQSLIVTMDGGGWDHESIVKSGHSTPVTFTIWKGDGTKITPVKYFTEFEFNIGATWNLLTKNIFGMSIGWPRGSQVGSVMAMASFGDPEKYYNHMKVMNFKHESRYTEEQKHAFLDLVRLGKNDEKEQFHIAAALQKYTEDFVFSIIKQVISNENIIHKNIKTNLCLSGGVSLNCVMVGKMFDVFEDKIDNIYVCPIPYDAGLAIGATQYVWHHILDNDRVLWEDDCSPYLGETHSEEQILKAINKYDLLLDYKKVSKKDVLHKIADGKIVSIFHGGSESGRRALGNRSIVADPRNPDMKDIINQKVKHRQWYRPFAPSILREEVKNWFVHDVDSPYMDKAIKFKPGKEKEVPAVNHYDNTARLQTVTKKNNELYYNFIKEWCEISGVPILLNTSFNDREPIVETPEDGIKCFLNTKIDHLYFLEYDILVTEKNLID